VVIRRRQRWASDVAMRELNESVKQAGSYLEGPAHSQSTGPLVDGLVDSATTGCCDD
jgi:hypothetical protein